MTWRRHCVRDGVAPSANELAWFYMGSDSVRSGRSRSVQRSVELPMKENKLIYILDGLSSSRSKFSNLDELFLLGFVFLLYFICKSTKLSITKKVIVTLVSHTDLKWFAGFSWFCQSYGQDKYIIWSIFIFLSFQASFGSVRCAVSSDYPATWSRQ